MCCGSNSHTVLPDSARSCAVAAHRSALLLVATTAPGADKTYGTLSAVVLPERGAMNAVRVSSQEAKTAGPRPAGRLRSPSSSPVSPAGSARGLDPASDGRSLIAVLAAGTGVSGVICGLPASAATGSPGRGIRPAMIRHVTVTVVAAAAANVTATRATS